MTDDDEIKYKVQISPDGREAILMPEPVPPDNIARFEGWLAHKHDCADLLPEDHPYKLLPPD